MLSFVTTSVYGAKATLVANTMSGDDRFVYADGDVSLDYLGTLYRCEHAKYDRNAKILYANGKVKAVNKKDKTTLLTDKIKIDEQYVYADGNVVLLMNGVTYKSKHAKYNHQNKRLYVDGSIEATDPKVGYKFTAKSVKVDDEYIYADGAVKVKHNGIVYQASHAKYLRDGKILEVWDNVKITDKNSGTISSTHAVIDIEEKGIKFNEFLFDGDRHQWASAPSAIKDKECYHFKDANYSSCNKENPDWHIEFSKADYNSTRHFVIMKHARFYVKKIPIFYLPYFGFSTLRDRTTGFLTPKFGYTTKGGYLYSQPFFWAIRDWIDIEFNPQVRHKRGAGVYATLRFADSSDSHGSIRVGYFRNFSKYIDEYDVDKKSYQGMEIRYESNNVLKGLKPNGFSDMLYINLQDYNDIDYINLQKDELMHHLYSKYRESRANYMLYNDDYYFGVGTRHFRLSSDANNDATLQLEPAVMFRKYTKEIADNLTYHIEANIFNHKRKEGSEAVVADFSMPLEYRNTVFGDYLKYKFTEKIQAYSAKFKGVDAADSISDIALVSQFKIYSDISKRYGDAMHSMQFYAQYSHQDTTPSYLEKYDELDDDTKETFITYKPFDDKIKFGFSQYYYGEDRSLKFKQRISQTYYPDSEYKKGLLRHELSLSYDKWKFYDISEYSWRYKSLQKTRNYIKYSADKWSFIVGNDWQKDLAKEIVSKNQLDAGLTYEYNDRLKLFASTTYDLRKENRHAIEYKAGFTYDKDCWNTKFTYSRESTYVGGVLENEDKFEVTVNLVPLGGLTL